MKQFEENYTIDLLSLNKNRKIFDISPLIAPELAVFPGDTPFQNDFVLKFNQGDPLELSNIKTTVHIGAHADAPSHYHPKGKSIECANLEIYMGECQVVEVLNKTGDRILPKDFASVELVAPRILFKTNSFHPNEWSDFFTAIAPETISYLAEKNVKLVGIDTPSIDLAKDKKLESHNAIFNCQMSVLEGLVLTEVNPGLYYLIALPLKIKGAEAAPVRAILIQSKL